MYVPASFARVACMSDHRLCKWRCVRMHACHSCRPIPPPGSDPKGKKVEELCYIELEVQEHIITYSTEYKHKARVSE